MITDGAWEKHGGRTGLPATSNIHRGLWI